MSPEFCAYLDESSASRGEDRQEYLVCAAVLQSEHLDDLREQLLPLRLKGQIKLHWSDESEQRRKKIVAAVSGMQQMSAIVSHMSQPQKKTERFRRKCLETLYYELAAMGIGELVCESRSDSLNKKDLQHISLLRNQKAVAKEFRITHCLGGDDPLLWLPDIFLGAVNAKHRGDSSYYDALKGFLIVERRTPDSL